MWEWGIEIMKNMIMVIKAVILITVEMTIRGDTNEILRLTNSDVSRYDKELSVVVWLSRQLLSLKDS